ncbi:2,5-diamino-6-hydroxy-4-(5-phosphoribosylamino)pyrimidine 1'-reductase [Candidatus Methanoperedens nitroreducens]|uniref:2,5-diamino-6-(ribosylamino)-4(3H)-pyrimidinone 5'-phosphate reductase n=1 Tax=Candidatus Methanoperedens nitratireducens TaxID=1392998 RepID=A0A062V9F1_9EURY|nr:2,5-diamino-6-(ribosylamino)-4(3H)-pyrimidinone 5'-phosphate reductase [Candidatus Methanoperedens nitroreducens]KCZ72384.1 2,5-diamino-6-hydroxy-4-(5-phosphoribosylamino)pyrimidine 1'-reductase [Candidatus Methanoperedens nitroreducens]MDJ1423682.1 2,5-diamino-6-(ribosylamino)-4(3H)-pyrimidinone 5'-phosphate reductase [Candidatus Methanoperedens sp.]
MPDTQNNTNKPARPFVFINAAMSADGKIATIERKQTRISGSLDFDRMDELRATSDAIMVGIGTMLSDNPSLTVKSKERREKRLASGLPPNPVRIVVDSLARTPVDADIFKKGEGRRIVAVSESAPQEKAAHLAKYAEIITTGEESVDLEELLIELKNRGINRLMVEGGATLNWGLISEGLVDEIYTFIGNIIIGGRSAPTLVDGNGCISEFCRLRLISCEKLEDGIIIKWRVSPSSQAI